MRIEAYTQVQQAYNNKRTDKQEQTSKTNFSDQLQISSTGKDIQTAKQAVKNAADIREEMIAPIKARIQEGTYGVSTEELAEKMLEGR